MAKKPAKKHSKPMGRKQMKKAAGGYSGGVRVAAADIGGDNNAINGGTLTGLGDFNGDGSVSGTDLLKGKVAPGSV